MMKIKQTKPDAPFLLAADIDGTLLGDEEGESLLRALVRDYASDFYLAYVTGRTLSSVKEEVAEGRLPVPDFISGFVGTELLDPNDPDNRIGRRYAAQVPARWDLEEIYALGVGRGVWKQAFEEGQPRFQAGFYWDGQPGTLTAFYARMRKLTGYQILPSSKTYIDVIPEPLGKGGVVKFLQGELGLDPGRVVVAGDSGNDRQMFETGFKGIVPGNALDELKEIACQPWHYHSPMPAGRGVMDGLRYFGFIGN